MKLDYWTAVTYLSSFKFYISLLIDFYVSVPLLDMHYLCEDNTNPTAITCYCGFS